MTKNILSDFILKKKDEKEKRSITIIFNNTALMTGSVEEIFSVSTGVWSLLEIEKIDYIYDIIINVYVNI